MFSVSVLPGLGAAYREMVTTQYLGKATRPGTGFKVGHSLMISDLIWGTEKTDSINSDLIWGTEKTDSRAEI